MWFSFEYGAPDVPPGRAPRYDMKDCALLPDYSYAS
jgi:hypothetical protein